MLWYSDRLAIVFTTCLLQDFVQYHHIIPEHSILLSRSHIMLYSSFSFLEQGLSQGTYNTNLRSITISNSQIVVSSTRRSFVINYLHLILHKMS